MDTYRFILEKYKPGGSNRYECPSCHRRKCFTRYVDAQTGEYVAEQCGRCNHENSCQYDYSPWDLFRDYPHLRREYMEKHSLPATSYLPKVSAPKPVQQTMDYMEPTLVLRTHSEDSNFMYWLLRAVPDREAAMRAFHAYRLGATREHEVIFWQIDSHLHVRTGKVMDYSVDGHRLGNPSWMHKLEPMPEGWTPRQCLFGEHLLMGNDKPVALVESEKTAIVMSCFRPGLLWLASGGCKQLDVDKLSSLKGRRLYVFPDSGEYELWKSILASTSGISYSISTALERYPSNTDLVDILL